MPSDAYDAAGNLTDQPYLGQFTYDAENRQKTATIGSVTISYGYDGDGRRVTKTVPSGPNAGTTVYAYDATGELAADYPVAATAVGTTYLTVDGLGSTRLVTTAGGAVESCEDYFPFGEQIPGGTDGRTAGCFAASEPVMEKKFTGKERDAESGLDFFGARYMSSAQGRFTSPDPLLNSGRPDDPQNFGIDTRMFITIRSLVSIRQVSTI